MHLNDLKSLFVVEDPHATKPAEAEVHPSTPAPQKTTGGSVIPGIPNIPGVTSSGQQPTPVLTSQVPVGTIDPAQTTSFLEGLRSKFSSSPFSAIIEQFRTTVDGLAEDIPQEGNRFRTALKLLKSQAGVDSTKLVEAYKSLVGILDSEAAKFGKAIEGKKVTEIDSRDGQVKSINAQIDQKNTEIAQLMNQRDEIASAIVEQKTKLGAAQASTKNAFAQLTGS